MICAPRYSFYHYFCKTKFIKWELPLYDFCSAAQFLLLLLQNEIHKVEMATFAMAAHTPVFTTPSTQQCATSGHGCFWHHVNDNECPCEANPPLTSEHEACKTRYTPPPAKETRTKCKQECPSIGCLSHLRTALQNTTSHFTRAQGMQKSMHTATSRKAMT